VGLLHPPARHPRCSPGRRTPRLGRQRERATSGADCVTPPPASAAYDQKGRNPAVLRGEPDLHQTNHRSRAGHQHQARACTTQLNPNCSQTATRPAITASDPALKRAHNHSDPPSCTASAVSLAPSGRTAGTAACCRRRCAGGAPSLLTKTNGTGRQRSDRLIATTRHRAHDRDSPRTAMVAWSPFRS
jgi:hypothetical protein